MANNTNNIRTGVIDIPGALRPLGGADASTNQVGGVVAYTGDIYDVTAGKNQAALNAEFAEGIANAGSGTGTITGATIGGNPVTESGGILQLPAYPTVPITGIKDSNGNDINPLNGSGIVTLPEIPAAPTADTMQYSGSTNYSTGSIGKEVKDLNASITDLSTKVADLDKDKPSPTPSPSITTVNLASYTTSGSSFTYDVDNKYIYNTKDTTFYQYSEEDNSNTVYYGVFKVIGEDRYLMYSITNNTTFTYVNTYTESTLPENAKKEFALGSVAVVKRVNGEGERWKNGTVNLFCTKQNMSLRNRCKNINFNGSTAWRVLIKSEDGNTIFVYKAKSNGNYEWEINVPRSSTANFNLLDKYFDRPEASSVSFDDNVTRMNVSTVQQAIQKLAIGMSEGFSDVTITLKTNGEQPIANKEVTIAVTYRGETYDLTTQSSYNNGFTTDSNGHIALYLPLGAVYQISFHQYNVNYSTPDTLNGIIDKPICNLTGLYVALNDNEAVLINVNVLNTTPSTNPNNKEAYIDYYVSGSWIHSYTAILSTIGTPKTIKDAQGNVIKSGDNYVTVDIPKNTQFRVRLQLWDTSLTEEEQIYIASSNISKIASNARSVINMSYTYALPGLYLIIKDSTTEKGYAEYKILNVDSTNNTMEIVINGINYTLSKDSSNNIYRKETNSVDSPAQWFTQSSSSDILGVGIRSSLLISKLMNDEFTYNLGYTNCCFRVARNFIEFSGQIATTGKPNIVTYSNADGMFQTRKLASFSEAQTFPSAQKAINNYKQTLNTSNGSVTIDGFIPATSQMEIFRTNYSSLMFIIPFINGPTLYSPYKNNINYGIGCSNNVDATAIGASGDNYRSLKGDFTRGSSGLNTGTVNFFVFYPF